MQLKAVEAGCAEQQSWRVSLEFPFARQFASVRRPLGVFFGSSMLVAADYSTNAQFREYYSGCGLLSTALAQRGINVKAYEACPKEGYRKEHIMSIEAVIEAEIAAAERDEIVGAHFGIVCSSWSVLKRLLNGGTRFATAARRGRNIAQGNNWKRASKVDVSSHKRF